MSKGISVVWIPGAWHGPEAFTPVADIVAAKGYSNVFVHTPSVGNALKDSIEDSNFTREKILEELDNKERDVVVICHSYGGVVCSNSCEGLAKKDREGKSTSVIGTIYLCAFALSKGACLWDGIGQKPLPWFIEQGDMLFPDKPEEIFYNDCSAGQQAQYKAALKPHSYNTMKQPVLYEVWKDIPSTYLICELDNAIPVDAQRGMIEAAGTFKDTKTIKASHSPFISMPQETADYVIESIEKHFKA